MALARIREILAFTAILLAATGSVAADDAMAVHVDVGRVERAADVAPVGGIKSAGQPDEQALRVFAEAGYAAVIDLRGENEDRGFDENAVATELGLEYLSLPIEGPDAVSFAKAAELDALLAGIDGPVLLHCGSGNRVGALLALRERLDGATESDALAYGKAAGLTGLEPLVRQRLQEGPGPAPATGEKD